MVSSGRRKADGDGKDATELSSALLFLPSPSAICHPLFTARTL